MTKSRKPLIIIGAGGHGKVVFDVAISSGWVVRGFLDRHLAAGTRVLDATVLGDEHMLSERPFLERHAFIVAIGDHEIRRRLSLTVLERSGALATLRHPSSRMSPYAHIQDGSVLAAGCVVNPAAVIGRFCVLNAGCTVDHDVRLYDGVQVCPGANLAGAVTCEEGAFIGTGAVVIPGVTIGERATVGAGAVVIRNVPARSVVVGNPAKVTRSRKSF